MKTKCNKLIFTEEYVKINGIDQYLFHSGTNTENPVMLFLHGGPGNAESIFAHVFQDQWEDLYTVVHWDQRGSGKTLTKNPSKNTYPSIELIIEDLHQIVQYLKKRYNKEKIILLGHSWGSVLGSIYIKKFPDDIVFYIGVGQVVNMLENERVGYEKVKELILQANDTKSLKKLQSIGDYPGDTFNSSSFKKCGKVRRLQGKYNLAVKLDISIILTAMKSPIAKFSDLSALLKGIKANEKLLDFIGTFDISSEYDYKMPIYYIIGENDWQTPNIISRQYFEKIDAPYKKFYQIPNAGHMTMMDQPKLFFEALKEIYNKEIINNG